MCQDDISRAEVSSNNSEAVFSFPFMYVPATSFVDCAKGVDVIRESSLNLNLYMYISFGNDNSLTSFTTGY